MKNSGIFKIKPAGRHILTIGEDLIQDKYSAIVELVKNSYDADAKNVNIIFSSNQSRDSIRITVEDDGHGMHSDDVIYKWLVPSTKDKLTRKYSPSGRLMQGKKGIGRYSASILGDSVLLSTTDIDGYTTTVFIEWNLFERAEYLEDVDVLVEEKLTSNSSGTMIVIDGDEEEMKIWDHEHIQVLIKELKKVIPDIPEEELIDDIAKDNFKIYLQFDNFYTNNNKMNDQLIDIKPFPLVKNYDYRIFGIINEDGQGTLTFINQKASKYATEEFEFNFGKPTDCGIVKYDIRAYDRERESILDLIDRGLIDGSLGKKIGINEAKRLLNENNGISVIRNGFRIRPLGDPDVDWLEMNHDRIQDPSRKLGRNQVIGYVHIEEEENSNLLEKSARDGLKKNSAYINFISLTKKVLSEIETRRYIFRRKLNLNRGKRIIQRDFERLYDSEELKNQISKGLNQSEIRKEVLQDINDIIEKNQNEKNEIIDKLKNYIAIYQGQATLGKIINVIMHEGRNSLSYLKSQPSNLIIFINDILDKIRGSESCDIILEDTDEIEKIERISSGIVRNSDNFVKLFEKLDPLSAKKREDKKEIDIIEVIRNSLDLFNSKLIENEIVCSLEGDANLIINAWEQDMYAIFTNLIDNSIYWISNSSVETREIRFIVSKDEEDNSWIIDYYDSGPGIRKILLEDGLIFEPEFSTKHKGTGLGLAIAGESAERNDCKLSALDNNSGAHFRLYSSGNKDMEIENNVEDSDN